MNLLLLIIGIGAIAAILIIIALVFKSIFRPKNEPQVYTAVQTPSPAPYVPPVAAAVERAALEDEEDELAAVIAAVLAVCAQSGNGLVVRQIRRVGETAPIWSISGRRDNILNQA